MVEVANKMDLALFTKEAYPSKLTDSFKGTPGLSGFRLLRFWVAPAPLARLLPRHTR